MFGTQWAALIGLSADAMRPAGWPCSVDGILADAGAVAWHWTCPGGSRRGAGSPGVAPAASAAGEASIDAPVALIHPHDRQWVWRRVMRAMRGEIAYDLQFRLLSPAGQPVWVRDTARRTLAADGRAWRFSGVAQLLSRPPEPDGLASCQGEAHFRWLADSLPHIVWTAGPDGRMDYVNAFATQFTGQPAAALLGDQWLELLHPDTREAAVAEYQRILFAGTPRQSEHRLRHHSGTYRWMLATMAPHLGDSGGIVGWYGTSTDIHELVEAREANRWAQEAMQRASQLCAQSLREAVAELQAETRRRQRAQDALLQSQKLEALGQLTSGVAHDFNNVLTAVAGSFELIGERATDERTQMLVQSGERAVQRASGLIKQLLAFARQTPVKPDLIDLAVELPLLHAMLHHAVGAHCDLGIAVAPGTWPVLCDRHSLEVALLNLAVNARDAVEGHGRIGFTASNVATQQPRPEGVPAGDLVAITASDTGRGMSPDTLRRATEPFFTTKGQGTGLGLAMVHRLALEAGGGLHIDSAPGQGTDVTIFLPRAALATTPAADRPTAGQER